MNRSELIKRLSQMQERFRIIAIDAGTAKENLDVILKDLEAL